MVPTLVFDADDTLWDEQGVLQAFEADVESLLDRLTGAATGFRERFIATENANIPTLGYGLSSYVFSVAEVVASKPAWLAHKAEVLALVADLISDMHGTGPRVIEGVAPTLAALGRDHRLVLLTRGVEFEQRGKLARSGLAPFFSEIRIVGRKDASTYRAAAEQLGDPAARTLCMIGNSLRSDIGPALAAGWRAIHVPAPTAWQHDEEQAVASTRFRRAQRFSEIADVVRATGFWR